MTTLISIIVVCLLAGEAFLLKQVKENRRNIQANLGYIKQNKELITQNSSLIHLINIMLSNSELKVDWDRYAEKMRAAGIDIKDAHRNQDIYNPEG